MKLIENGKFEGYFVEDIENTVKEELFDIFKEEFGIVGSIYGITVVDSDYKDKLITYQGKPFVYRWDWEDFMKKGLLNNLERKWEKWEKEEKEPTTAEIVNSLSESERELFRNIVIMLGVAIGDTRSYGEEYINGLYFPDVIEMYAMILLEIGRKFGVEEPIKGEFIKLPNEKKDQEK